METEKPFLPHQESKELRPEMSHEEFEAAVIRQPELLESILIDNPMALLDKVQKDIDASPDSPENEKRRKTVGELRQFYNQRTKR